MSPKQFETFWWPTFRKMLIGLIDAGLIPMPLWEADCTKRLEMIRDIPAGKCIYWFERTDMVKAFEVLGDVVALARQYFALAADHRNAGRSGRRGAPSGGKRVPQGRQADPRRAPSAYRTKRRSRTCAPCSRPRANTRADGGAQRHADGPQQRPASRDRGEPVRRGRVPAARRAFAATRIDLIEREDLLNAAYCYRIVPLDEPPSDVLRAGGETLDAPAAGAGERATDRASPAASARSGRRSNSGSTALFAERRMSLALALDELGNELLFALSRRAAGSHRHRGAQSAA